MNSNTLGSDPPALPALDNTLGAMLLGTFAGLILEGLLIHQGVRYFRLYPNDSLLLKLWVSAVLLVEAIDSALNMHMCFYNMVVNYFNPFALNANPIWSAKLFVITGCCSAVLTESFFMRRVWLVGRRYRVLVIISICIVVAYFACYMGKYSDLCIASDTDWRRFAVMLRKWNAPSQTDFLSDMWLATLGSGLFGCSDLITTSILIHVLRKSRTGIKRTNWTIDVLVRYAFTTGFIITFFQVISIICVSVLRSCPVLNRSQKPRTQSSLWPTKLIFWPVTVILTKTAASSMLISLNMRDWLGNTNVTDIDPMSPFTTSIKFQRSKQPSTFSTPGFQLGLGGKVTQTGSSSRSTAPSEAIELDVLEDTREMGKHDPGTPPDVLDIKHDSTTLVRYGEVPETV
ncbi:hypothetical protein C8T65DRAFT_834482 [Cerioporus squamosus]|nr:hypothetical protein C8T65DRAFT_834482 [Cerioporus squamosus]